MTVIHLIPVDSLGGVEQAARSLDPAMHKELKVCFMSGESFSSKKYVRCLSPKKTVNSFSIYFKALAFLMKSKPKVLICSLWRSSLVGLIFKFLFRKKTNFVVFVHNTSYKHFVDKLITRIAFCFADYIWCDSRASYDFVADKNNQCKVSVISFFIKNSEGSSNERWNCKRTSNDFIYWGRLAPQKNIEASIDIFLKYKSRHPDAKFHIYGIDSGALDAIKRKIKACNAEESILLMGPKKPESIPREAATSTFFINSSHHEGMAISVIEAMQAGLIPVVSPVGEIPSYCIDGGNSIYIDPADTSSSVDKILYLVESEMLLNEIRHRAKITWEDACDYNSSLYDAYSKIITEVKFANVN
ncbi:MULTISPECIES: glycosyltransferase family 4 protein [Halomonadaceae]|uniref:glycosyltransferase family 4 protein n=1 Tax=Halomonadaceae TaxID=28256 RepID=UPI001597D378|nr:MULTISPECIES: glycosyltransferase [Halomonas]QJQ94009.1 glycosyltransferase [Halomonas sp. PA5]